MIDEKLTKGDIDKYLSEINERLSSIGKQGEIVMAGGAVFTAVFNARQSTRDIDAFFQPSEEMRKIISDMSEEHDLPKNWLNDGVKGFITSKMNKEVYQEFSNLSVYTVDAEGLLALKLTSARMESWDMSDSIVLMKHLNIGNVDELYEIVEKYTHKNQQTPTSFYFTQIAFETYQEQLQNESERDSKQKQSQMERFKRQQGYER